MTSTSQSQNERKPWFDIIGKEVKLSNGDWRGLVVDFEVRWNGRAYYVASLTVAKPHKGGELTLPPDRWVYV